MAQNTGVLPPGVTAPTVPAAIPPLASIPAPRHHVYSAPPMDYRQAVYPTIFSPGFPLHPVPPMGVTPQLRLPQPSVFGARLIGTPVARPIIQLVMPPQKPQTSVFVGKIAPTVDNEFLLSLLRLCGPVKSWKRASAADGILTGFGFCEFESAEGILRAMRLLRNLNIDGQELLLNIKQDVKEYLERYVEKKTEREKLKEPKAQVEKDNDGPPGFENHLKSVVEETKKDAYDSMDKENQEKTQYFGIVTEKDRGTDRDALEKIANMIEERLMLERFRPPVQALGDGSDVAAEKNDDEAMSESKPVTELDRPEISSPNKGKRHNSSIESNKERDLVRKKEGEVEREEREQHRFISGRDKGRAFCRSELFHRDRVNKFGLSGSRYRYPVKWRDATEEERNNDETTSKNKPVTKPERPETSSPNRSSMERDKECDLKWVDQKVERYEGEQDSRRVGSKRGKGCTLQGAGHFHRAGVMEWEQDPGKYEGEQDPGRVRRKRGRGSALGGVGHFHRDRVMDWEQDPGRYEAEQDPGRVRRKRGRGSAIRGAVHFHRDRVMEREARENMGREKECDLKRDTEQKVERYEGEQYPGISRRQKTREKAICGGAECFHRNCVVNCEATEREKEYQRQKDRDMDKQNKRDLRWVIDTRKRMRNSVYKEKWRKTQWEKEDALADRLKKEEEIVEAKKRVIKEQPSENDSKPLSSQAINEIKEPVKKEAKLNVKCRDYDLDHIHKNVSGSDNNTSAGNHRNIISDEPVAGSPAVSEMNQESIAPSRRLRFDLLGSKKRPLKDQTSENDSELLSSQVLNESKESMKQEAELYAEFRDNGLDYVHECVSGFDNNTSAGVHRNIVSDELAVPTVSEAKQNIIAPAGKLRIGLASSGKQTVPSYFLDEDAYERKMRPLLPICYWTEELQTPLPSAFGRSPYLADAFEFAEHISSAKPKEERPETEGDRIGRYDDMPSNKRREQFNDLLCQEECDRTDENTSPLNDTDVKMHDKILDRERDQEDRPKADNKRILDAKQLIDMIPKTKEELFAYEINWATYDKYELHERIRPWISKKITEFLGGEEPVVEDYIISTTKDHVQAPRMLELVQSILDDDAEMFVLKMWRVLIFEIKKIETGNSGKSADFHVTCPFQSPDLSLV